MDQELMTNVGEEEVPEITDEAGEENEVLEGGAETDDEGQQEEPSYYTQEQMESAIKNRVSTFNKKIEKMKPYEQAVKKISEITGLSIGDLVNRLEGMSDVEQAKILGVSPEQLAQQRRITQAGKEATETATQLRRELEEQKLMADPKFKDYALYRDEVQDLIEENPKLTLKQAYVLAKGDLGTQAAVRDAEQRAVAKMTKSSNQRIVKPGTNPAKASVKIDAATVAAAKKVGMDPAEYAAYAGITDLEQFERMKGKKG